MVISNWAAGSRGVNDDVKTLAGARRDEIARELIVLGVADLEGMFATRIALPKPLPADRIGNIEVVEFVGDAGLCDQRPHPVAVADRVGGKIQHHGKALPQDVDDVRRHRGAKPRRIAAVVLDGLQIIGKQGRGPVILADQQRRGARGKTSCKRRFARGDLSAEKIQGWCVSLVHARRIPQDWT